MKFSELSDQEKADFYADFYALWRKEIPYPEDCTDNNPAPWGMPWEWCGEEPAVTPAELLEKNREEILALCKQDQNDR